MSVATVNDDSVTINFGRALGSRLGLPWRVSPQLGAPYGRPPIDAVCTSELYPVKSGIANAPRPHSCFQVTNAAASSFSLHSSQNESSQPSRQCPRHLGDMELICATLALKVISYEGHRRSGMETSVLARWHSRCRCMAVVSRQRDRRRIHQRRDSSGWVGSIADQ